MTQHCQTFVSILLCRSASQCQNDTLLEIKKKPWHCRKVLLTYINRFPLLFSVRIIWEKDIISSVYKLMIFLIMIEITLQVLHCTLVWESKFCLSFFYHFFFISKLDLNNIIPFFNGTGIHAHAIYNKVKTKVECMYFT